MSVEFIRVLMLRPPSFPVRPAELARAAEDMGWTGAFVGDTQHLSPEAWLAMGNAIEGSTSLKLAIGVTNPSTRDVSITASAAAGAQYYSGGRFTMGIGRGDSAVHKIGRMPASLDDFETYVSNLQEYLHGNAPIKDTGGGAAKLWSADVDMLKPPVDIAGTGPKVIAIAAKYGDRVSFSVGADPARMKWAIEHARSVRREVHGAASAEALQFGAYLLLIPTDDLELGRNVARGLAAIHHRFTVMNTARPLEQLSGVDLEMANKLSAAWKASEHGLAGSNQSKLLTDEFLDSFAIIGPPNYCIERLEALVEAGISRFWVLPPAIDVDPGQADIMYDRIATSILPHFN